MQPILMPVDFSETTDRMIEFVSQLAPPLQAQVCVLHVSQADMDDPRRGRELLQPKIDEVVEQLKARGCDARPLLALGPPALTVLDQMKTIDPLLVVLGSHGHSAMYKMLMGSVTGFVMKYSQHPVLVVPSPQEEDRDPSLEAVEAARWDEYGMPFG